MIIDVSKIVVKNRIRKDFGDITELATDINDNGLISPIVVNKDYVLLAGERRLRAVKRLGWKQVEVRMMDTRDAEHELNIEISENDVRKAFSKSERVDYMYRLMRIEKEKARERQEAGVDLGENFPEGGRAKDKTAAAFGISGKQMEREMQIVEHKDLLDPADFANWDEGKLSTNKAYQKIKAELNTLKEKNKSLDAANRVLSRQVNQGATVIKQDVVPDDYEYLKTQVNLYEAEKKHFNEAIQGQIVKNALAELIDFMNRYRDIKEFAELFDVIERVTNEQINT